MVHETVMFNDLSPNGRTVDVEGLDEGTVYISSSSAHSLCVARRDEGAVRLLNDRGVLSIAKLDTPAKARKILGRLVGVVVEKL